MLLKQVKQNLINYHKEGDRLNVEKQRISPLTKSMREVGPSFLDSVRPDQKDEYVFHS